MEYLFQFDTEFISANTSVKKITTLREFYNKSLTKFKEGCQLAQIVEKEENSLEDCVAALKKNIGEGAKLKVKDQHFRLVHVHVLKLSSYWYANVMGALKVRIDQNTGRPLLTNLFNFSFLVD